MSRREAGGSREEKVGDKAQKGLSGVKTQDGNKG